MPGELPPDVLAKLTDAELALEESNKQSQEAADAKTAADRAVSDATVQLQQANDALAAANSKALDAINAVKQHFGIS